MSAPRKVRCGARLHRQAPEAEACPVPTGQEVALTPLGRALIDALRDDPRYRDIIADPFGENAAGA